MAARAMGGGGPQPRGSVATRRGIAGGSGVALAVARLKPLPHVLADAVIIMSVLRHEPYCLVCGERLAWGRVDHPPLYLAPQPLRPPPTAWPLLNLDE